MQFWQSLIFCESEQLLDVARSAESLGYTGVVLPDHVAMPEHTRSSYPYSDYELDPRAPFLDPWPAIGAMAAVTDRLRFSTYVYVLPMRDPFSVAKSVATTSILANGRVAVGIGVGWLAEEFEVLGHEFKSRGARSDEMLAIMSALWRDGHVEYHGRHFDVPRVHAEPRPSQPIPIYVGGHSDVAIRRAAAHDGWMGLDFALEEIPAFVARLSDARRAIGREQKAFEIQLASREPLTHERIDQLEAMGVTALILPAWALLEGDHTTLAAKQDQMASFASEHIGPSSIPDRT